jgi:hypothetical protein
MELTPLIGAFGVLVLALFVPLAVAASRTYLRWREPRLVRCPQTGTIARVNVDARTAAASAGGGAAELRLKECTLWPRATCVQACLSDIQAAPDDCRVRNIVARWYEGKRCVFCRKAIPPVHLVEHHPALMNENGDTLEWNQIAPEQIPDALATNLPVCWDCHVADRFRREHPQLVVDRDNLGKSSRLVH